MVERMPWVMATDPVTRMVNTYKPMLRQNALAVTQHFDNVIRGTVTMCIHPHMYDVSYVSIRCKQEMRKFRENKMKIRQRLNWIIKAIKVW